MQTLSTDVKSLVPVEGTRGQQPGPQQNQETEKPVFVTEVEAVEEGPNVEEDPCDLYDDQTAHAVALVEKQKDLNALHISLEAKREEVWRRLLECDLRQASLDREREKVEQQRQHFAKFIKDNDYKRLRSQIREKEEMEQRLAAEQQVHVFLSEIEQLQERVKWAKGRLEKDAHFGRFLESVMNASDEFLEVKDIIERHHTLAESQHELAKSIGRVQDEVEGELQMLKQQEQEGQRRLFVCNSTVAGKTVQLENLRKEVIAAEHRLGHLDRTSVDTMRLLGEVKFSVENIYSSCRMAFETAPDDVFGALTRIQERMHDIQDIVSRARKKNGRKGATSLIKTGS